MITLQCFTNEELTNGSNRLGRRDAYIYVHTYVHSMYAFICMVLHTISIQYSRYVCTYIHTYVCSTDHKAEDQGPPDKCSN